MDIMCEFQLSKLDKDLLMLVEPSEPDSVCLWVIIYGAIRHYPGTTYRRLMAMVGELMPHGTEETDMDI